MNWSKFLLSPIMAMVDGSRAMLESGRPKKEALKPENSGVPAPQGIVGGPVHTGPQGIVGVQCFINPPTPEPPPVSLQSSRGYCARGYGCQCDRDHGDSYEEYAKRQSEAFAVHWRDYARRMCEEGDKLTPCVVPPGHQGPVKSGCWCTSCRFQG